MMYACLKVVDRITKQKDRLYGENALGKDKVSDYDHVIGEQYGIIKGSPELLFIKIGRSGTIYGYEHKYLEIAHKVHSKFGCSVAVSANPVDSRYVLKDEIDIVKTTVGEISSVIYVGVSNGALEGAWQGWKTPCITAMLLINGPIMINWYKTKEGIELFKGKEVMMVYGEKDPSYPRISWLDNIRSDVFNYRVYTGQGHNLDKDTMTELVMEFVEDSI